MLKKISMKISLLLFVLCSASCLAQTTYPKGVYMTMVELQDKQPSQFYNLVVTERAKGDVAMAGGNEYKVESPDNKVKGKVIRKEIVAISDGTNLYINGQLFDVQQGYCKVVHEGRALLFKGGVLENDQDAAGRVGGPIAVAITTSVHYAYKLYPRSLKIEQIDRAKLEALLTKHEDLRRQYEEEKVHRDPDVILKYLAMVNE